MVHCILTKNETSILVPLYNEEEFVASLLVKMIAAPLPEVTHYSTVTGNCTFRS